jgi:predicted nucleic acid-binding protein
MMDDAPRTSLGAGRDPVPLCAAGPPRARAFRPHADARSQSSTASSRAHGTAAILGELFATSHVTGNLVPDAQLAALAIEHGLVVHSADTDFARFPEVRWVNPLA